MPADPAALEALLARLEGTAEGSRELDVELFKAFCLPTEWFGWQVTTVNWRGDDYDLVTDDGCLHKDVGSAGSFTASLDAAVALAERVLPGCWWTAGNCRREAHATIGHEVGAGPIDQIEGLAPSGQTALALCRAPESRSVISSSTGTRRGKAA